MSLANCKLQQSLKIKEEKITELDTKYALTPSFVTYVYGLELVRANRL